jgi:hypothetical protein
MIKGELLYSAFLAFVMAVIGLKSLSNRKVQLVSEIKQSSQPQWPGAIGDDEIWEILAGVE